MDVTEKTGYDCPFWVVLDQDQDSQTKAGFVAGYNDEEVAKASAAERSIAAKMMGIKSRYVVVPRVA